MARSSKTLSLHTIFELADRGTRRDMARFRAGWSTKNFTMEDVVLAPADTHSIPLGSEVLYIATNAEGIELDFVRSSQTTSFKLNKMILLTDLDSVTGLTLRNTNVSGTPDETIRIIRG